VAAFVKRWRREVRPSGYLAGHWEQAPTFHHSVAQTSHAAVVAKAPLGLDLVFLSPRVPCGAFSYGCCFTLARWIRKYFSACCPSIAVSGCLQTLQWINR